VTENSAPVSPSGVPKRPFVTSKTILEVIGVVMVLAAAWAALSAYIDSRVDDRIHDPGFLAQLSRTLRPSVVFDSDERILADLGAMQYLKALSVTPATDSSPLQITIEPAEFLGVEPVLESLDHDAVIQAQRGKGLSWVFTVRDYAFLELESSPTSGPVRFRLEILR
jgi:hypothetical protein